MANKDKQFVITGTGSLVAQEFGFWSDSQAIATSGAACDISFNGTDVVTLTPGTAFEGIAYSDHRRCKVWVRGSGATVTVTVSAASEL